MIIVEFAYRRKYVAQIPGLWRRLESHPHVENVFVDKALII